MPPAFIFKALADDVQVVLARRWTHLLTMGSASREGFTGYQQWTGKTMADILNAILLVIMGSDCCSDPPVLDDDSRA